LGGNYGAEEASFKHPKKQVGSNNHMTFFHLQNLILLTMLLLAIYTYNAMWEQKPQKTKNKTKVENQIWFQNQKRECFSTQ